MVSGSSTVCLLRNLIVSAGRLACVFRLFPPAVLVSDVVLTYCCLRLGPQDYDPQQSQADSVCSPDDFLNGYEPRKQKVIILKLV